jgi:hypothetical protein
MRRSVTAQRDDRWMLFMCAAAAGGCSQVADRTGAVCLLSLSPTDLAVWPQCLQPLTAPP